MYSNNPKEGKKEEYRNKKQNGTRSRSDKQKTKNKMVDLS